MPATRIVRRLRDLVDCAGSASAEEGEVLTFDGSGWVGGAPSAGPQGEPGEQGEQGEQGLQGEPGEPGPGFQIGSSYLSATSDIQAGLASGAFPLLTWNLGGSQQDPAVPSSAGSDLSINVGDTGLIDIATEGWYQATVVGVAVPDTTPTDTFTGVELVLSFPLGGGAPSFNTFVPGVSSPSDPPSYITLTTAPVHCLAGYQFSAYLGAYLSDTGNTWSANLCALNIVRMS